MKSFPSSFTKDNLVQPGKLISTNLQTSIKNIAGTIMNNALGGTEVTKQSLGEYLEWKDFDYAESLSYADFTSNKTNYDVMYTLQQNAILNKSFHENVRKIPALTAIQMNKYRKVFTSTAMQVTTQQAKDGTLTDVFNAGVSPSLFSPLYGVQVKGITVNTPLMTSSTLDYEGTERRSVQVVGAEVKPDGDKNSLEKASYTTPIVINNDDLDFTDCSIRALVMLSNGLDPQTGNKIGQDDMRQKRSLLGRATYKYADFMYCSELGKMSNNHLITLRKFAKPIGDNIFKSPIISDKNQEELPSIGTLVTWFGTEDNKLENICKYDYQASWKATQGQFQDIQSKEDDNKLLPSLVNLTSRGYIQDTIQAKNGSNNMIYDWLSNDVFTFKNIKPFSNTGSYENENVQGGAFYVTDDPNRVYTPKNIIRDGHIYEGILTFNQEITLVFNYTLRSYDGINPKSALLDLLGNILNVTYMEGTFWGGARRWFGAPRNEKSWQKVNNMFDALSSKTDDALSGLFGCSSFEDVMSFCGGIFNNAKQFLGELFGKAKNATGNGEWKRALENGTKTAAQIGISFLRNKLGRPAIYAMKAILDDDNVGLWHVTIGNPRNPIMVMGNMILTSSSITHSGPLGIDDFPTNLRVEVKLKHAMPRDATKIAEMYTMGQNNIVHKLNRKQWSEYYTVNDNALGAGISDANKVQIINNLWTSI